MALRTTMPSAPYDLSSWNSCVVATPLAFHTTQVSTVVAAHWMSPEAMARWRLACGIFLMVTSRPFFAKMPASLARVSGAKPVQPEIPMTTLVPCASAGAPAKQATSAAATILIDVMFRSIPDVLPQTFLHDSCHHGDPGESNACAQIRCRIAHVLGSRASKKGRPAGAAPDVPYL